jgi:hypothetical protein
VNGLGALAGYVFYFCYLCVVSGVHQLTLAYQDFSSHLGEATWTLAYVAPAPVQSLAVSLVHYERDAQGRFVVDARLNSAQVPPMKSAGRYLIRVRYRNDHTAILWSGGSSEAGSWTLPEHHTMQKRLAPIAPGKYILWLGSASQPKPTLESATEYLALEVQDAAALPKNGEPQLGEN